ncbi:MAG: DMT family transporter [Leptothrix sp. (in: b-proteobacteria)]
MTSRASTSRAPTSSATPSPKNLLAVSALLFNALVWGLSWWPLRQLQAAGLHPLWATVLIYTLAVVVIGSWRPRAWRQLATTPALWLILLAAGGTNLGFNWGVSIGEVTRVLLLFYLMPLWTALLARWLLKEPAHAGVWLRVALALAGAVLVLAADPPANARAAAHPVAMPHLADALALLGGFCFAFNNVMLRREAARAHEGRALAMFVGGALVALTVATLSSARVGVMAQAAVPWPPAPSADWLWPAIGLALLFLGSNLALQFGATRLPANLTAVIMPAEIVFGSASAALWAGERLTPGLVGGGALILTAAVLASWRRRG